MQKVLTYTLQPEDLEKTAGGLVNLILKNCVHVTGHEISGAKYIPDGITVDGRLAHVSERIRPGQTLRVILPEDAEEEKILPAVLPEGQSLEILYEDEDLLILNKPAGMVSHPSPGHYADSLANYVAGIFESRGEPMVCRIAGRLDKETSGAICFAKNRAACARLFRERGDGNLKRTYLALVHGTFRAAALEGDIRSRMDSTPGVLMVRRITGDGSGAAAETHYHVLAQSMYDRDGSFPMDMALVDGDGSFPMDMAPVDGDGSLSGGTALVECTIATGRTHQIRLHMASIGHPLVGDTLYGPDAQTPDPDGHIQSMPGEQRALLHAYHLSLIQPFTGEHIEVTAPLPDDMKRARSLYNFRGA